MRSAKTARHSCAKNAQMANKGLMGANQTDRADLALGLVLAYTVVTPLAG